VNLFFFQFFFFFFILKARYIRGVINEIITYKEMDRNFKYYYSKKEKEKEEINWLYQYKDFLKESYFD
jgi:hypothetical protein